MHSLGRQIGKRLSMVGKQAAQPALPAPDVFMDRQSFDNRPMHVAGRAHDQSLSPRDLFAGPHLAIEDVMQRHDDAARPRLGNFFKPDRAASCKPASAFQHAQLHRFGEISSHSEKPRGNADIACSCQVFPLGPCGMQ